MTLIDDIKRDRAACGDTSTLATTAQITAYASRSKRLEQLEDAYIEQTAEIERMRSDLEKAGRWADGIRGAVESNQVADKDVRGVAVMIRDNARAALEKSQ